MNNKLLLGAGVLVGPLFISLSIIIGVMATGFDFSKHELSLLLIGKQGWIQEINFVITGLLSILCAIGLKRALLSGRASKWGPLLMGIFGVMFLIASVAHPDGHHSFPAGAPVGITTPSTIHAGIHSMAFSLLTLAVVIDGIIFARRYSTIHRLWSAYSIVNSILIVILFIVGGSLMARGHAGIPLLAVAIAITFWVSAVAIRVFGDSKQS